MIVNNESESFVVWLNQNLNFPDHTRVTVCNSRTIAFGILLRAFTSMSYPPRPGNCHTCKNLTYKSSRDILSCSVISDEQPIPLGKIRPVEFNNFLIDLVNRENVFCGSWIGID